MLYSDIKRLVLSHIDRYSLQGVALPLAYSLQSDDENRIPFFVNEGVLAAGGKTRLLPPDPAAGYNAEGEERLLYAACLYAAAALVRRNDESAYTALYREFQRRLPILTAEVQTVTDVYGGGI